MIIRIVKHTGFNDTKDKSYCIEYYKNDSWFLYGIYKFLFFAQRKAIKLANLDSLENKKIIWSSEDEHWSK